MGERDIETHPVQMPLGYVRVGGRLRTEVTMRAYEVYCHCYGEQKAMVTDGCRGGFSVGEIVAFLYARTFPKAEWKARVDEAMTGMRLSGRE